jgi:hypothetical protein
VIPNSTNRFLVFSLSPDPASSHPSTGMMSVVAGSTTSASTKAWSRPCNARSDFGGGLGSVGRGNDGRLAIGELEAIVCQFPFLSLCSVHMPLRQRFSVRFTQTGTESGVIALTNEVTLTDKFTWTGQTYIGYKSVKVSTDFVGIF